MAQPPRSRNDEGEAAGRSTAYWGLAFVVLLFLSGGMVTVPGEQDGVAFVRDFYQDNTAVIVTAQVIGLVGAAAFLGFARGLQRSGWVGAPPWVLVSGAAVAAAAVLAAVPPLVLVMVAGSAEDGIISSMASASDWADVALFTAIAAFAVAVTVAAEITWVRWVSAVVALLSGLRAGLLAAGSERLEVVSPISFVVLVLCLAWSSWRRRRVAART